MSNTSVVACIPYYRCQKYVRRAVESLLAQTHRDLVVVVLNDADHDAPWPALADIRDSRLVRFDLAENRGPYFATQVTLAATSAPYLLIQDADDWSHPERIARLLTALERDGADLAVSAQQYSRERPDGAQEETAVLWEGNSERERPSGALTFDTVITPDFLYRAPHVGLFRTQTLRNVGGYYGGFRIVYDVLLTNMILMIGKVSHVPEPLYHRLVRPTSLTYSGETGLTSGYYKRIREQVEGLYSACFAHYCWFLYGRITGAAFMERLRSICSTYVTAAELTAIHQESRKLMADSNMQTH